MDDLNKHLGEFIETNNEYFKIKQMEEKMKTKKLKSGAPEEVNDANSSVLFSGGQKFEEMKMPEQ